MKIFNLLLQVDKVRIVCDDEACAAALHFGWGLARLAAQKIVSFQSRALKAHFKRGIDGNDGIEIKGPVRLE